MTIKMKWLTAVMLMLFQTATAQTDYIRVTANDTESLLNAIKQANERNRETTASRLYIMIPNGVYHLKDRTLTAITGHNIALVGESMRGTVIINKPAIENEGISKTATLLNRGTNLYLQDLTLKNDLDYYKSGAAGRAVCLQDKGTRTICKNVCMLSYQDTYYTDNEQGQTYLENTEIHGTVDFICGAGDTYFNRCTLVTERRKRDGSGRTVIAAPRTNGTPWGYVFESCTVYNRLSDFAWARGWKEHPHCTWLNTMLMSPEKLTKERFDPKGMGTIDSRFHEFHTMDASGKDITPETNMLTFTLNSDSKELQTVYTAEEVAGYRLENIFPGWRPEKMVRELVKRAEWLKRLLF